MPQVLQSKEASYFVHDLRKALSNNWETGPYSNKKVYVNLTQSSERPVKYHLDIAGVNGNGYLKDDTVVHFDHFEINMTAFHNKNKEPTSVILTAPSLFGVLDHYYHKICNPHMNPINRAVNILTSIHDDIYGLNHHHHYLPGKHYQNEILTDCERFKLISNDKHVTIRPLSGKPSFNFAIKTTGKRGYIINAISVLIDTGAYLMTKIQRNYGQWQIPLLVAHSIKEKLKTDDQKDMINLGKACKK